MAMPIYHDSTGEAVHVTLSSTVAGKMLAVVEGWLGINEASGDSDDVRALTVDDQQYQFWIPDALDPAVGDTIYIDPADLTGHIPNDSAYSTAPGAGLLALCKVVETRYGSAGAYYVTGKSLLNRQGA